MDLATSGGMPGARVGLTDDVASDRGFNLSLAARSSFDGPWLGAGCVRNRPAARAARAATDILSRRRTPWGVPGTTFQPRRLLTL